MNTSLDPVVLTASLRDFVLGLNDAVVVLGAGRQIVLGNAAARALLSLDGRPLPLPLADAFGANAAARVQALLAVLSRDAELPAPLPLVLENGRSLKVSAHRLDPQQWLLRLAPGSQADAIGPAAGQGGAVSRELLGIFWDSPFPASLQGPDFRLVAVNDAFLQFTGYRREQLIGIDPASLQPEADRAVTLKLRSRLREDVASGQFLDERRLLDAQGRERWFRAARRTLKDDGGQLQYLALLQDCTPEHAAREQADRSENDLNQWFDMSPVGMALFDGAGLLVRTNPALEALVGTLPVMLDDASLSVRRLLAWEDDGPCVDLAPGAPPLRREAWSLRGDGSQSRLGALVRGYVTPAGHRRYMAAVQDLSAEDERDLARMQIGAVMDTAGVGVATFQDSMPPDAAPSPSPSSQRPLGAAADGAAPGARGAAGLQSIGRDLVEPESLPEYERLQLALRRGQRIEARYAIRHPELGLRWLLTRVEPGQLASGKRTTSVVTLDVTDKEQAQARNDQLLRELGTILESSPAGIVYLRGETLVRCNRRFERMVGLVRGSATGRNVHELLAEHPVAQKVVREILGQIDEGSLYETELEMPRADGLMQWASLSARGFRSSPGSLDVIAVLSDITRLKLQQSELETLVRDRELMFSLSEVGIVYIRNGHVQQANEAMEQLSGYPANQLAGLDVGELFADRETYRRAWEMQDVALRERGRWGGERELRRSDGSLVWVQVSKRLVVEGDLSGGVIASFVNIDDRRRAEASVAQQAETTRAVLDSVLVGIVTVGRDGIEWMNRSARRMFGGGLAEFRGQPISTVATPEEDHPFRRTHYLDALNEGQAETFECRVKARDGREFWVAGNAVVTRHMVRGRQLTYALLDIERRRSAELRTARAQASLQRIIDMAPLAIALCDARSLRVLQINQTALALTGRADADVIGRAPDEIFPPAFAASMRGDMAAALASAALAQHEYQLEVAGQQRVLDARYLPLAALGETPDQLLLVATDVTEQRAAAQARLDAALAQRDRLVQEVHHRIKNNLQGVAGLLQQMAQRHPEVAAILAEGIGQVQAIAQVYGLQVGVAGPLRVKSLVEAITGSVQRSLGREVTLGVLGDEPAQWERWVLPEAESIPIALTLNELLSNAVKHSADASVLSCTLSCGEDRICIAIANLGALPAGFDLARVPGGISGLGLVRALLPRRHSKLEIQQQGDRVVARIELVVPGVILLAES